MSKLADRRTKLGHTERTGFGFGARATNQNVPVILLVAKIEKPEDSVGIPADVFILSAKVGGTAQSGPVDDAELWGVAVSSGSEKDVATAVDTGADFVLIEDESAPGVTLRDDDVGTGFSLSETVSDNRSKAIESSPFDFLVLDGKDLRFPLDVRAVLDVQEQLALYSRHTFLEINCIPGNSDLELLRDFGISGLIYDSKTANILDLKKLKHLIGNLQPKKRKTAAGAVIPRGSIDSTGPETDHEDYDFEDDD